MERKEFILHSDSDGLGISCLMVLPDESPRAVLQISHGMCGCKERYMPFMEYMASHGIVCIANDHRGHGESVLSSADLGYMYEGGYEALAADMRMVFEYAEDLYPTLSLYLLGHSMGSLAALISARQWGGDLSGLILCGIPYYKPIFDNSYSLLRTMCHSGKGRLRLNLFQGAGSAGFNRRFADEGQNAWVCSDPAVRQSFLDNPKCNFSFTMNGYMNLLGMLTSVYSSDMWINAILPDRILMLSGADDPCTSYGKSLDAVYLLMNSFCTHELEMRKLLYPHMRHEILNEKDREKVWNDILFFVTLTDPVKVAL